jgi:hypothetical protein
MACAKNRSFPEYEQREVTAFKKITLLIDQQTN